MAGDKGSKVSTKKVEKKVEKKADKKVDKKAAKEAPSKATATTKTTPAKKDYSISSKEILEKAKVCMQCVSLFMRLSYWTLEGEEARKEGLRLRLV